MIKTRYCWNGDCPFQCKTTISANLQEYIDNDKTGTVDIPCQMRMRTQEPIWKDTPPTVGLDGLSEATKDAEDKIPDTLWHGLETIIEHVVGAEKPLPALIGNEMYGLEAFQTTNGYVIVLTEKNDREAV